MASSELVFKKSVAKDLRRFPKEDVGRIMERIRTLATDPRPPGCEKLSGLERYRLRQGAYRIVYEIEDRRLVVLVVKAGHRRDVYRTVRAGMQQFMRS
jgi:mRNA interferase RelE/StbE